MALSKKVKRILLLLLGFIIVFPIVVILLVAWRLGPIIKIGVEKAGPMFLGVRTSLEDADVSIFKGQIDLQGLDVGNPEGFDAPSFMKAGRIYVDVNIGALRNREMHIQEVALDAPEFTFEFNGNTTNVQAFLERLKKGDEDKPEEPKEPREAGEVKLKIDLLRVTDAQVHAVAPGLDVRFKIPSLEIRDIADENGNAVPPDQILVAFLRKFEDAVLNATELGKVAEEIRKAQERFDAETRKLEDKIREETGIDIDIRKTGEGLLEGARGLFDGSKPPDKQQK